MLIAGMSSEEIKFVTKDCHGVGIASHRDHAGNLRLDPSHCVEVENVNIIEALVAIVPSEHVKLASDPTHSVTGTGRGLLSADLRFGPNKAHRI